MSLWLLMNTRQSSDRFSSFIKAYWAALLWAAFVLLICIIPGDELPDFDFWELNIEDKLAHVGVFFILGVLIMLGNKSYGPLVKNRGKAQTLTIVLGITYGIATEAIQGYYIPGRFASFPVFLADSVGVIIGTFSSAFLQKMRASGRKKT